MQQMAASQQLNSDFPEVIEEEASVNGGPSFQYVIGAEESLHRHSQGSRQQLTTTLNEQAVIEYEHALMAL